MPLSDDELRILNEIEQQLYGADDNTDKGYALITDLNIPDTYKETAQKFLTQSYVDAIFNLEIANWEGCRELVDLNLESLHFRYTDEDQALRAVGAILFTAYEDDFPPLSEYNAQFSE